MPFQIVQIIYWLALSTWFGGVLFFFIATPIIFKTVREANPILPDVLSVNLEAAHGNLLAGSIMANLLVFLGNIQLTCGGVLLLSSIAQFFLIDLTDRNLGAAILRLAMIAIAIAIAAFHRFVVWPKLFRYRQEYVDQADNPEIAKTARDNFDREHYHSETLLKAISFLLLGTILFSANIFPASVPITSETSQSTHTP
jgi:Domain of unknown function (DUF4149)